MVEIHNRIDDCDMLLHFLAALDKEKKGWMAVHIQLSKLRPKSRSANQLRIAAETMESLFDKYEGRLFMMPAGDVAFFIKGVTKAVVEPVVDRLRYLFSEDPLFVGSIEGDSSRFVTWYDLITEYRAFQNRMQGVVKQAIKDRATQLEKEREARLGTGLTPIEPSHLAKVGEALNNADLSEWIRGQSICLHDPEQGFRPVFREFFVSIGELNRVLMAEVDITANRWLFQYLTNLLDQRMLSFLIRNNQAAYRKAFSININVSTLLTPEFKKFDQQILPQAKRTIMFELQAIDVYSDMGAFVFARDTWQEKGYRFCLDGLNHLTLPLVDRRALGLDLLKINWSTEMVQDETGKLAEKMQDMVSQAIPSRVIFARCDSSDAVQFGRSLGISLFQGRYMDKVVAGGQG